MLFPLASIADCLMMKVFSHCLIHTLCIIHLSNRCSLLQTRTPFLLTTITDCPTVKVFSHRLVHTLRNIHSDFEKSDDLITEVCSRCADDSTNRTYAKHSASKSLNLKTNCRQDTIGLHIVAKPSTVSYFFAVMQGPPTPSYHTRGKGSRFRILLSPRRISTWRESCYCTEIEFCRPAWIFIPPPTTQGMRVEGKRVYAS